jgi:hypothetical protein
MSTDSKAQALKELMEALEAHKGLAEKMARLSEDLREGRITAKEADPLIKAHGAAVRRFNKAMRKAVKDL